MTRCVAAAAAVVCFACGDELQVAPSLFSEADNVQRVRSDVVFDTLWVLGGPEDTVLAMPMLPRHDGALGVVFFDLQNKKVYRVGADGELLWSWGRAGEGPGEITNVRALDVRTDGSVVLVDSGNRRVVTLSSDGEHVDEVPLEQVGFVHSVAALSSGRLALHASRPLVSTWSTEGAVDAELPAALGETRTIQHQGRVARWRGGQWVFGFGFGNGWLVFDGDGNKPSGVYPYVEHTTFPDVISVRQGLRTYSRHPTRPVSSGRSLSVLGDTLFVLFGGTRGAGWVLDRYDVRTGRYLASDALPHYTNRAVVGPGRLFTVYSAGMFPSVVALSRRRSPSTSGEVQ